MPTTLEHPNRDLGARLDERERQALRDLLKKGEVADLDPTVRQRIGELIGRGGGNSRP